MRKSRPLLEALFALTCVSRSLYGPNKQRKHITDVFDETIFTSDAYTLFQKIQSHHASTEILQQVLNRQKQQCGSGCTTLVNMCHVLLGAVRDIVHLGIPVQHIQSSLSHIKLICLQTVKQMRLPLNDLPKWSTSFTRNKMLQWISHRLDSKAINNSTLSVSMEAALSISTLLGQMLGVEDLNINEVIVFREMHGSVEGSITVYSGLLVPLTSDSYDQVLVLQRLFSNGINQTIYCSGIALIDGDVEMPLKAEKAAFTKALANVQVLFVYGEMNEMVVDMLSATTCPILCVVISDYKTLLHLSRICTGVHIVPSIYELTPFTVYTETISLQLIHVSPPCSEGINRTGTFLHVNPMNDSAQSFPSVVSVLLRNPTPSLNKEFQSNILKDVHRLRNTYQSEYVLPGSGAVLSGLTAALQMEMSANTFSATASEILQRITEAFVHLGVTLLENTGESTDYLANYQYVSTVRTRYLEGMQQLGPPKFFTMCPYNAIQDYAILPIQSYHRMDDYRAMKHALEQTFRLVNIVLGVSKYQYA